MVYYFLGVVIVALLQTVVVRNGGDEAGKTLHQICGALGTCPYVLTMAIGSVVLWSLHALAIYFVVSNEGHFLP